MFYFLFLLVLVNAGKTLQPVAPVVITNKTVNVVKPKSILDKVVADPKQFVAEIQNLDPTALRTIITLLEDLLTTSEEREDTLNNAVSDADNAVSDAANGVADAEDVLTGKQQGVTDAEAHLKTTQEAAAAAIEAAEAALAAAEQAEANAQGSLDDAKADHTQKVTDKEEAESARGGELDGLNHEQQVLREVIAILEDLHSKHVPGPDNLAELSPDNWNLLNGATIEGGVAKLPTGSVMESKTDTFSRPLEISWTSRLLPGQGDECAVMDVFPQWNGRHAGYSQGYGWWGHYLGSGFNDARMGPTDGDITVNHVYKMVLTDTSVEFYQDDTKYNTIDSVYYMSGKIRFGNSCRDYEVSDVTVVNL